MLLQLTYERSSGLFALLAALTGATVKAQSAPRPQPAAGAQGGAAAPPAAVKRSEYLVKGAGCADCHTPHKMGPDADLKAIFAYLRSIRPVKNRVPDPVVATITSGR